MAKGYLAWTQENFWMCLTLFFIITKLFLKAEYLIPIKLNKLIVAIVKKPAPDDHESSLKKIFCKLSLPRCPCAPLSSCRNYNKLLLTFFMNLKKIYNINIGYNF